MDGRKSLRNISSSANKKTKNRALHDTKSKINRKRTVSFKALVDIFHMSDAWKLQVKTSTLKTEEEQQARSKLLQRNY